MAELSTLARPYAKAAFEYASENAVLDEWAALLAQASAVCGVHKVQQLLQHPALTAELITSAFLAIIGDKLSAPGKNFVTALVENRRLALLPYINRQFQSLKAAREKTIDVTVKTAYALSSAETQQLAQALATSLEREVKLETSVDESLIGGVVIRAGDTVIDGSVKSKLSKLGTALSQ